MSTYTAPTTRASGALITASIWNTDLVENIKFFREVTNDRMTIDSNGRVMLGQLVATAQSADSECLLDLGAGQNAGFYRKFLYHHNSNSKAGFGTASNEARMFWSSDSDMRIGTVSTSDGSTFAELLQIKSTGAFGIAVTPAFKFHVAAANNITIGFDASTVVSGALTLNAVNNANSANVALDFRSAGTYFSGGIDTTSASSNAVLDQSNSHRLLRSTSSRRYKRDIEAYNRGLADLLALRPVSFRGTSECDGDKLFAGLIAEEVHEAGLSEFVSYDNLDQPDALHYGNMIALIIKAVQELKAQFDAA